MFWKLLIVLMIFIFIITFIIFKIRSKVFVVKRITDQYNTIIFHERITVEDLQRKIVKGFKLLSPIKESFRLFLPLTQNISHWEIAIQLDNGKYYVVSSSHEHYIELYKAHYNKKDRVFLTTHSKQSLYAFNVEEYNVNKNITFEEALNQMYEYYSNTSYYNILGNNCHKFTTHALKNILGVNSKGTEFDTNYKFTNLFKEFVKNNKYIVNNNGIVI